MNRKQKFAAGSFVIVAAVVALIYTAARETSAYFLTMEEYASAIETHEGKTLRLAGRVTDGSVDWNPRTLDLSFAIEAIPERESADTVSDDTDAGNPTDAVVVSSATPVILAVRYNGILPDMFAEGRDVIVEGRVTDRTFHAETLLTTCPSKYEADVVPEGESPTDAPADQIARG